MASINQKDEIQGFDKMNGRLTIKRNTVQRLTLNDLQRLVGEGLRSADAVFVFDQQDPQQTLYQVQVIRDCLSLGIRLVWEAEVAGEFDFRPLFHLIPPRRLPAEFASVQEEWLERYRYGSFFWRKGPDFLLVKDVRVEENATRYTIDQTAMIELLQQCEQPVPRLMVTDDPEVLDPLLEEGLLLDYGGYLLTLPYRVHKWPLPYNAI